MSISQQQQQTAFADKLRERIIATGKSQRQIARDSGIEESGLSRFMSGNGGLSLASIEALLATLTRIEESNV